MRASPDITQRSHDVWFEARLVHCSQKIDGLSRRSFQREFRIFDAAIGETRGSFAAVDELASDERAALVDVMVEFYTLTLERFSDVHSPVVVDSGSSLSVAG